MFITLTIDTNIKNRALKVQKSKINPSQGWRKPLHFKKRTLSQRVRDWRKELRGSQYKLDGQAVMF